MKTALREGSTREMRKSLGIYLHVPFCVQKCRYCDFCSVSGKSAELITEYCKRLAVSAEAFSKRATDFCVDTVYFGGGTPSLMSLRDAELVMNTLASRYDISSGAEITFECNPATADLEYFRGLRSLGVNRISMGLQSALDSELALLGRIHTAKEFSTTFNDARRAGFDNISADLMYGIPDQTMESFRYSIDYLASHEPEHISAYALSVEEGTYFHKHRAELSLADDDMQSDMYLECVSRLRNNGYERYEISNFAKNGKYSRHNTRYWRRLDYLGFGVAAHSCFDGKRFGNSRDISAFLRGEDITEESTMLTYEDERAEYIMLGLRLVEGIDTEEFFRRFGEKIEENPITQKYIENGFMRLSDGRLSFEDKGFLVSNAILADII